MISKQLLIKKQNQTWLLSLFSISTCNSRLHCLLSGKDVLISRYIYTYICTYLFILYVSFNWLIIDHVLIKQSGEIHFYNSRTNKRTSSEPSKNVDLSTQDHHHMSLDLELNLPCDSTRKNQTRSRHLTDLSIDVNRNRKASEIARSPSWLAFEGDQDQEMVATACMKCHMLVMLCKSSPTCPNCKFMHPPDQSSPKLFKQRLSLLC